MEARQVARSTTADVGDNPLFGCSLTPMLLVDDDRRCVDANAAACLFLRQPVAAIRKLTIDDLTAPELRPGLHAKWSLLLLRGRSGATGSLLRQMQMPDGTSVAIDLSVTAQIRPGRHLAIIKFSAARAPDPRTSGAEAPPNEVLTNREREVLTLVALGNTGVRIASQLFLSPATVQTHVANALIKLGAKNRAHGIALALQTGALDIETTPLRH